MERAVEVFAAVQFLVIGLSHILQPRVGVDFFVWLRGKGHSALRCLRHEFVIGGCFFLALFALMLYVVFTR